MRDAEHSLGDRVNQLAWYHRMELPGGIVTPGKSDTEKILPSLGLPGSLAGKSVLDVGAWDGFYSFECARRGAASVLATDSFAWQNLNGKTSFSLARRALGLEETVQDLEIDIMDLSPERVGGTFDVVLFTGVLYHCRDTITALERVSSVSRDLLILSTVSALNWLPYSAGRVYPATELVRGWAPNTRALVGLLKRFSFQEVVVRSRFSLPRRLGHSIRTMARTRRLPVGAPPPSVVLHARKKLPA